MLSGQVWFARACACTSVRRGEERVGEQDMGGQHSTDGRGRSWPAHSGKSSPRAVSETTREGFQFSSSGTWHPESPTRQRS